jgi:hypothetical protein
MYAVMRLNTSVVVTNIAGQKHKVSMEKENVMGYIPVYKTKKEAIKHSEKGRFQILKLQEQ